MLLKSQQAYSVKQIVATQLTVPIAKLLLYINDIMMGFLHHIFVNDWALYSIGGKWGARGLKPSFILRTFHTI